MKKTVEVCAGSLEDCIIAHEEGADRIELNSALNLGGLTPSIATLVEAKKRTQLPIITMVRCRPGGFHYDELELTTMFEDAKYLIEYGSDGIVFGFLNSDGSVNEKETRRFVDLAHKNNKEAIFHRAFDRTENPYKAIEILIDCGVDRVLTSGLELSAEKGSALLQDLNNKYGGRIELCAGAGISKSNVLEIIEKTGITQVHASFKGWFSDPTTSSKKVSYSYSSLGDYEGVDRKKLQEVIALVTR